MRGKMNRVVGMFILVTVFAGIVFFVGIEEQSTADTVIVVFNNAKDSEFGHLAATAVPAPVENPANCLVVLEEGKTLGVYDFVSGFVCDDGRQVGLSGSYDDIKGQVMQYGGESYNVITRYYSATNFLSHKLELVKHGGGCNGVFVFNDFGVVGWSNIPSSVETLGGCTQNTTYADPNQQEAQYICNGSCPGLSSLDNDGESSETK